MVWLLKTIYRMLTYLPRLLYGLVLLFFRNINRKVKSKLPVWKMEIETSEHVHLAVKAFKWIILPASLLHVGAHLVFFGENALSFMIWAQLIFFYSSFLPDLPSIFRRKKKTNTTENLPWYKKYALLLFAPVLIWALFSGLHLNWKTTENFHNFKSLTIYAAFLLICGFFAFAGFPPTIRGITETLSLPLYGTIGYLTHLRVDRIW